MSNLFNNILKSEMYRNRADGLTTKLYELAKDLGYTFVAANSEQVKHLAYNNIVAINGQQPSFHGSRSRGFIFDHYALHVGCMEAQTKIEKLEDTNEELKTKVSLLEQDLDSVKREKQILTNSFLKTMNEINKLKEALEDEVETLRLKLAACGVAALCNTRESACKQKVSKDSPYYSASYEDICDAVNREMDLREENEKLKAKLEKCKEQRNNQYIGTLESCEIDEHIDENIYINEMDKELEGILK